jgi:magnesium chelatase subunit D
VSAEGHAPLAFRLLSADPKAFGGIWLHGDPVRTEVLLEAWGKKLRRLPLAIDDDRLSGGLDVAASLALGRAVHRDGLLAEARDEMLLVAGAERMPAALAARLAQALDEGGPALILLTAGERPPETLLDRLAFHLDVDREEPGVAVAAEPCPEHEVIPALARCAEQFAVASPRALIFAMRAARAMAGLSGRGQRTTGDVVSAARLVFGPRALTCPDQAEPQPPPTRSDDASGVERLEDRVVDAVRVALPSDLLEALVQGAGQGRGAPPHGAGARRSGVRGRPTGARQALPRSGVRLALIETLRAAAPWQRLRTPVGGDRRLRLRKEDLHVRRHQDRETALTIFAVDASGSAAAARLGEAKGAVERLLQRSYAKRAEVALLAFRGEGAQILLPPTRSLARAKRLLAELPGGGATPLAAGLDSARGIAEAAAPRGRTPLIVVLSDGRANVAADGGQSRSRGQADATAAARRIAAGGTRSVFIDISARRQPEAAALAGVMGGRYLHLPRADAAAIEASL